MQETVLDIKTQNQSVSQGVISISLYRILFQMGRPLPHCHSDSVNWAGKHSRFTSIISNGYKSRTLLIFHKSKVSILKNHAIVIFFVKLWQDFLFFAKIRGT